MPGEESPVAERISDVREVIGAACRRIGREPGEVRLVLVTKTVPVPRVIEALRAGVPDVGENRAVELAEKAELVRRDAEDVRPVWHFLGKLQRGTAARVADHADVVHSAEPGGAIERVGARAHRRNRTLLTLIEVDFTGRRQGAAPEDLPAFVRSASRIDGIHLVGLMTVPPPTPDAEGARPYFARLRELRDLLATGHPDLRELSMGMSADYPVAVEEGATMVRVGTAVFGRRPGATRPRQAR